jgi:hypothetical protein
MKRMLAATLSLIICLPGLATATGPKCNEGMLKGQYVFTASGFTRAAGSGPGTPWVPKAIIEVLQFNGDGTLSTPAVTVANPFGDFGNVLTPSSGGAAGSYSIDDDILGTTCSGTVQFHDATHVTFKIYVAPRGDTFWMIQSNSALSPDAPANSVFQGSARRVW